MQIITFRGDQWKQPLTLLSVTYAQGLTSSCWKDIACCKGSLGMEQLLWWTLLWKINPNLTIVWKGWKCTKKPNHIFMGSQTHKGTVDVSKWTGCLIPCLEIFRCGWQRGDTLEMMLHSKAGKASKQKLFSFEFTVTDFLFIILWTQTGFILCIYILMLFHITVNAEVQCYRWAK